MRPRRRTRAEPTQVFTVRRAHGDGAPSLDDPPRRRARCAASPAGTPAAPRVGRRRRPRGRATRDRAGDATRCRRSRRRPPWPRRPPSAVLEFPVAADAAAAPPMSPAPSTPRAASCSSCASASRSSGCASSRSTSRPRASRRRPAVHPREVARHHPEGERGRVHRRPRLGRDRDGAWPSSASSQTRRDLGGLISAGGSGGTALATAGHARACRSACPR